MVTRNIFTHDVSFYCRQTQRHHNMYAELKSTYAEVISIGETEGRIYFCNLGGVQNIVQNIDNNMDMEYTIFVGA